MKTSIEETSKFNYIIPQEGDIVILTKGITKVYVFNQYGQQLGKLPLDKSQECFDRMCGQPVYAVIFHVGDKGSVIVIDIHFNDNKRLRDAYIVEMQIGRLKSQLTELYKEHANSFATELENNKKNSKRINHSNDSKKKVSVRGLYYKGKKVIKNTKKKAL